MARHAPGTVGSLVIIAAAVVLILWDDRRRRRGERRNRDGRCARCGEVLDQPGLRVQIAGGPRFQWRANVCRRCYGTVRLQERVFWIFLATTVVTLLAIMWWSRRS